MALIKTVFGFFVTVVFMLFLTPFGFLCWLLSFVGLKKLMRIVSYRLAQSWAKLIILCTGCKVTIRGRENIPKRGALCFVSNHGSMFDIVLLLALAGRPVGFIAKKELALIPVVNLWIFLLGGLFIDRKDFRKALKTINAGVENIKAGGAMIIFPEGTRSKGEGLLAFKSGAFKLATQSNAPISPISISGSYDVFEKTKRLRAVPVNVVISPVVNTAELSGEEKRKVLPDKVHGIIAGGLV